VDVERTVGILNAIAAGMFRILEIMIPVLLLMCMGIIKAMASAFVSADVYRRKRSGKKLLTDLDEI
jgi:membrane protein implicated in regulation of membrane protease activity